MHHEDHNRGEVSPTKCPLAQKLTGLLTGAIHLSRKINTVRETRLENRLLTVVTWPCVKPSHLHTFLSRESCWHCWYTARRNLPKAYALMERKKGKKTSFHCVQLYSLYNLVYLHWVSLAMGIRSSLRIWTPFKA